MVPRTLAALSVLAVLAGCSGDPEPKIADPKPSVASSPAAPSPSVSAAAETPEAFIERWFATGTMMQTSNQTTDFRSLSAGCKPCEDLVATVDAYYGAGGYIKAAPIEIQSVKRIGESMDFVVRTRSGTTEIKSSSSAEVKTLKGGPVTYRLRLAGTSGAWQMQDYFVDSST